MLLLPIKVNNHTNYMVDFESSRQVTDSFVIDASNEGVLFSFYLGTDDGGKPVTMAKVAASILFQKSTGSTSLHISGLDYNENESLLRVSLVEDKTATSESNNETFNGSALFSYNGDDCSFRFGTVSEVVKICVEFCYSNLSQRVDFFLAPTSQIIDAVIDSGSEATQIAVFKRGDHISVNNIIPILDDTLVHFGISGQEYNPNQFIQAEVEGDVCNQKLLKTRFFVKKNLQEDNITDDSHLFTEGSDPILKMLVTQEMLDGEIKGEYIQLYNMKIASFGGVELPYIRLDGLLEPITEVGPQNYYYRKYLNVFLCEILKRACRGSRRLTNPKRLLSLHVLMPNVYTPQKTQECLDFIIEDLKGIIEEDKKLKDAIVGFDVTAISESDASLVGAISQSLGFGAGTYLIMDAGKGTLDFSVAKLDKNGILENKMKSGIVGGSAAISYGFMLDLLQTYLNERQIEEDDIKTFVFANILGKTSEGSGVGGGDLHYLNNLMNAVDAYKIRYDSLKDVYVYFEKGHTDFDNSFKLDAFINWINDCNSKIEILNVTAVIDTIVNYTVAKIATSLKDVSQIDKVVYAGRGFLFEPLKSEMRKALEQKYPNIQEEVFIASNTATNNKNVCMFISDAINRGQYNYQQLPKPSPLDQADIDRIKELDKGESTQTASVWDLFKNGAAVLKSVNDSLGIKTNNSGSQATSSNQGTDDNPFVKGYNIDSAPNRYYAIGGHFYHLGPNAPEGEARIFHGNGKIYIRYNKNDIVEELTEIPNLTVELAFPSLFPFCDVSKSRDIYLPHVPNEPIADESSSATEKKRGTDKTEEMDRTENLQHETSTNSNEETTPNQDKDAVLEKLKTQTGVNKK